METHRHSSFAIEMKVLKIDYVCPTGPSFILSCRGLLAAMIVISFFNALAVRNTFTIAFVAMVNFSKEQNQNESNGFCPENNAHSNHTETIQVAV